MLKTFRAMKCDLLTRSKVEVKLSLYFNEVSHYGDAGRRESTVPRILYFGTR